MRALEALLGRYPGADLKVRESLPAVPPPPPVGVLAELLERRPDIVAAEQEQALAGYGQTTLNAFNELETGLDQGVVIVRRTIDLEGAGIGRLLLYATTKAEGPVLRSKRLFTGCDFQRNKRQPVWW